LNNAISKVAYDNDVDSIKTGEKREYIQIQTAKMLLRQLKPFTKTWALPGDGPNNFKVKPKLNKKLNIRFGKEALELADIVLMGPGGKTEVNNERTLCLLQVGTVEKAKSLSDL
jgi:hypothetical protein